VDIETIGESREDEGRLHPELTPTEEGPYRLAVPAPLVASAYLIKIERADQ
jgi:hypothetical protein